MEINESAACGISQKEFAIELDDTDLVDFYRVLLYAHEGTDFEDVATKLYQKSWKRYSIPEKVFTSRSTKSSWTK